MEVRYGAARLRKDAGGCTSMRLETSRTERTLALLSPTVTRKLNGVILEPPCGGLNPYSRTFGRPLSTLTVWKRDRSGRLSVAPVTEDVRHEQSSPTSYATLSRPSVRDHIRCG